MATFESRDPTRMRDGNVVPSLREELIAYLVDSGRRLEIQRYEACLAHDRSD